MIGARHGPRVAPPVFSTTIKWALRATALAATLALAPSAFAEGKADVEGLWELFAKNCKAVVVADDPATKAAGLFGPPSSGGMTEDGAIAVGAIEVDKLFGSPDLALVTTTVHQY